VSRLDSGTGLTIRPMAESDLDRVMEIAAALATAPQWAGSAYEAAISTGDGTGEEGLRRIALVAEHSGEVIGFAIARVVASLAEIETIGIRKNAQGFGFGSDLMRAVFEELKLVEVNEVELEVRASNGQALWFYGQLDFVEVGRRREYYRDPVEDAVLMRRLL
jgi:[ribosomal protein S18]-alanine N-acetyltransferase